MKSAIRNVIFLVLAIVIFNKAAAQKAVYTTNRGMTIGFGLGAAYQQSDIANSKGSGFDFTLGSYIYKKENALLSVDWKFRFLGGENKAYDHRINTDGTYSNVQYTFFNYDLELGLVLNRLRERTRILISGFAGAGITQGITSADLLDANGNPYDYSVIDPNLGRKQVYADLLNLSDKKFETKLNNKAALMPTLGIYLGYQFSRSFSLGIEHKINFSLTENNSLTGIDIDNKIVTSSKKDRNHYTSLGFVWILGGRSSGSVRRNISPVVNTPVAPKNYNIEKPVSNPTPVISVPPPVVEIISPSGNTYSTTSDRLDITARVKNVRGKQDIQVVLNEKNIAFDYSPLYGNVSSRLTLTGGKNILVIIGSNEAGSTRDDVVIIWNKPVQVALPEVKFIDPSSPLTVEKNIFSISVQTRNVKGWQDVTVTVNGINTSNFNLSPEGVVTTNIPLKEGLNKVEVKGKNEAGIASDLATITYAKPVKAVLPAINVQPPDTGPVTINKPTQEIRPCPKPGINFIVAAISREDATHELKGTVSNVMNKNDINITVNDNPYEAFTFVPNTGEINTAFKFDPGSYTIKVTVKNGCGSDSKTASVSVAEPCIPPQVSFTLAAVSREEATHEMKGTVSNVKNKNDINITVNDNPYKAFTFVPNTGEINSAFEFDPGSYTIKVTVKNGCGQDEYSRTVVLDEVKPCGIRLNPGNSSWEFCLVTPSGTIRRDTLTNSSFSYSGPAGSLYFMPIAGGGDAVVRGMPYNLRPGQYYLFTGNLTVSISTKNPGSMGQWSVCIIADSEPLSGNGNNRPKSPCEEQGEKRKPQKDREPKGDK